MLLAFTYHQVADNIVLFKTRRFIYKKNLETHFKVFAQFSKYILKTTSKYSSTPSFVITFDDGYEDFYKNVFPLVLKYSIPVTAFIITNKIGRKIFEPDYNTEISYLNEHQILEIHTSGLVDFQPHSHNHYRLSSLPYETQRTEITTSIDYIERMLSKKIDSFCFPYGDYNSITLSILKDLNIPFCFTTVNGINENNQNMELHRIAVNSFITGDKLFAIINRFLSSSNRYLQNKNIHEEFDLDS